MMFRCLLVVWRLLNFAHDLHYTIWTLGTTLFTGWLDHPSDLLKSVSSRVPGWFTTALDPHQRPKKPTRYTMSLWNFFTNLTTEIRIRMESWKNHPTVFNSKKRAPFFFWSRENAIRNCGRFHQSRWSRNLSQFLVQASCAKEAAVKDGGANRLLWRVVGPADANRKRRPWKQPAFFEQLFPDPKTKEKNKWRPHNFPEPQKRGTLN